jgi:hypothetical protein
MTAIAERPHAAHRGALGTAAALAGIVTAGVSAAFLALLVSDQSCGGGPQPTPSADAQREIPPRMLAAYEQAAATYNLPWPILAGIGQEECAHGRNPDPSCAVQPGAAGPGVANFAGASGPMQIGVGGAAGDEYQTLRRFLPPAEQGLGPHDPIAAADLAALVLIRDKGALTGKPIDAYLPYVRAYNGSGPTAVAYANRVIADAHRYQGLGISIASVGCAAAASAYVNPFSHATGVTAGRIDQGVDYSGHGPIVALGDAKVTYATAADSGWAYCGGAGAITLDLTDGPDRGRPVYITEGISPSVRTGETVAAGQAIATFVGADCLEIGWSSTATGAAPEAAALGQQATGAGVDAGDNRTYCGNNMSQLLASVGAPAGLTKGRPVVGNRC